MYWLGKVLWASGTDGKGGTKLVMQSDGNVVLYTCNGKAVWATNTNGKCEGPYNLKLQDDQNLVVYAKGGVALWASNTAIN